MNICIKDPDFERGIAKYRAGQVSVSFLSLGRYSKGKIMNE